MWKQSEEAMTKNITMAVEEDLLKKARKIAVDKNTTLTSMIRTYLQDLIDREKNSKQEIISELSGIFENGGAVVGEKTWTREDLHER